MPVYADVLIVVNGFVNYLLLLCTMKIMNFRTGRMRLLLGALTGSLFSLKIFLPALPQYAEFFFRIVFAVVIVLISFRFSSFKSFLKCFTAFFAVNFGLSGIIIAMIYLFEPPDLLYDNGVVYYNISFISLIILSTASFAVISIIEKILSRKTDSQKIYGVTIFKDNLQIGGRGLLDTGNCLKDAFSGASVIVADINSVSKIMPENIKLYLDNQNLNSKEPIRIIPVSTVNGTGLLPAFKADKVLIKGIKNTLSKSNVYIAVSKEKFFHGEFEFLLNNNILEDDNNEQSDSNYQKTDSKNQRNKRSLLHKRT